MALTGNSCINLAGVAMRLGQFHFMFGAMADGLRPRLAKGSDYRDDCAGLRSVTFFVAA